MNYQTGKLSAEEAEIYLDTPYSVRDLGKAFSRKASKILRECKTVLSKTKTAPPLHE